MKDLLGLLQKATEMTDNPRRCQETFMEILLEELKKMKGGDLARYLSCEISYDDCKSKEYKVTLALPITLFDEYYPFEGNIK